MLNAGNDMDNVGPGFYFQRYGSTAMPANSPPSAYNASIRVYKAGETGLVQEWYSLNQKKLYVRQLAESGGTWTAWYVAYALS